MAKTITGQLRRSRHDGGDSCRPHDRHARQPSASSSTARRHRSCSPARPQTSPPERPALLTATIQDAGAATSSRSDNSTVDRLRQAVRRRHRHAAPATRPPSAGVATKTITGVARRPGHDGGQRRRASRPARSAPSTVVHGAAADIVARPAPTVDLASGATRVLTATIEDAAGNTVTVRQHDGHRVRAGRPAPAPCQRTGNATAAAGVATKTITGVLAGSVTMEATGRRDCTTGTLGAFTVVHGAATQIALTGSTADLASGATRVLTATIQDAAGNTVTSDNTTVIAFAKAVRRGHASAAPATPPPPPASPPRRSPASSPARSRWKQPPQA